ncbi:multicopper oxidase family protein [Naasia lichenicola]|uniref:multicopper oxidase family protein n=1 Tax=Naasia lichenicola TaxID=2565933 RepID=UPI00130DBCA4|nr:multicopper oxidase family protein [Naasia lichenicola]
MSTSLLLLDLVVAAGTAAAWAAAAVLGARSPGPTTGRSSTLLLGAAMVLLVGQGAIAGILATRGWPFAQEKLAFAIPLQLLTAGLAVTWAVRERRLGSRGLLPTTSDDPPASAPSRSFGSRTIAAFVTAAAAAVAGLVARTVVGFPLEPAPAVVLCLLVACAGVLAYAVLERRPARERTGAAAMLGLIAIASLGGAWLSDVASPGALVDHAHGTAPAAVRAADASAGRVSVDELRTPADAPGVVRHFDLTARQKTITSASGAAVDAWTFGSLPGPEIRVRVGEIVDVTLRNRDITDGVTLHWHGYDVPNGEDGVAGATQDPVMPGESFDYRFVADEPGTYWYHTHQGSLEGIARGLFGALIVLPYDGVPEDVDILVPLHTFASSVWLGGSDIPRTEDVASGESVRLRLINTDQLPRRLRLTGADFRIAAVDGRDLTGGSSVRDEAVRIPAGGRMDLVVTIPDGGVLLTTDSTTRVALGIGPRGSTPLDLSVQKAGGDLDLLAYGTREFDVPAVLRDESMVLDQLPRFVNGAPLNAYTVNGSVFPHIESIEVSEGDVIRLTVVNRSRDTHPMHIHGHHVLVLSRNGIAATGATLWLDTFDVQPGETWQVMLIADNPGIWMDHCHNLEHAAQGMMMALAYDGVTTPYEHTRITG